MILNKIVAIKGYGLGSCNCILGVIYLNGKNISLEMVRTGLVEAYRGKPPKRLNLNAFWQAERKAKQIQREVCARLSAY